MQRVNQPLALIVGGSSGMGLATKTLASSGRNNRDCGQFTGKAGDGTTRTVFVWQS